MITSYLWSKLRTTYMWYLKKDFTDQKSLLFNSSPFLAVNLPHPSEAYLALIEEPLWESHSPLPPSSEVHYREMYLLADSGSPVHCAPMRERSLLPIKIPVLYKESVWGQRIATEHQTAGHSLESNRCNLCGCCQQWTLSWWVTFSWNW